MITKALIDRFLRNACTAEEKQQVIDFLEAHPEELDNLLPPDECPEVENVLPEDLSARMWQHVRSKTRRRFPLIRVIGWSTAAAAVMIGMIIFLRQPAAKMDTPVETANTSPWREHINQTNANITLSLPDGSTTELQPRSGIKYKDGERAVYVNGAALFKVAGNAENPFTVYAGVLTIKVLGTSFAVNAFEEQDYISVRLMTGRVSVAANKEDIRLKPGQELVYNKKSKQVAVKAFNVGTKNSRNTLPDQKPDWFMFNGQSLPLVLDQLSEYYQVNIDYRPADMTDLYFAGRFERTDSLDKILQDIASLNGLSIQQQAGKYIIRKSRQ